MDKKVKVKWLKALRSGKYRQARHKLYDGKGYCCLGVLCRVVGAKSSGIDMYGDRNFWWSPKDSVENVSPAELPQSLRRELKITPSQMTKLIALNDGDDYGLGACTFKQIADHIEAKL